MDFVSETEIPYKTTDQNHFCILIIVCLLHQKSSKAVSKHLPMIYFLDKYEKFRQLLRKLSIGNQVSMNGLTDRETHRRQK